MQVLREIILFSTGILLSLLLFRFRFSLIRLTAKWFWSHLLFTHAQNRFLKFLNLGWLLFPWFSFFTLYAFQRRDNFTAFFIGMIFFGLVRVFNHQSWKLNSELFDAWLREQGVLKEQRPHFSTQQKVSIQKIATSLAKQQTEQTADSNYFDLRPVFTILLLGFIATDHYLSPESFFDPALWVLCGFCLMLNGSATKVRSRSGWIVRCVIFAVAASFFEPAIQRILLASTIWICIFVGLLRDVRIDLAWELRPRHLRRASGELQMVDSHKIVKLRAIREFGDTLVLGRPYQVLFLLRDLAISPSLRWALVRFDAALAASLLLFSVFKKVLLF